MRAPRGSRAQRGFTLAEVLWAASLTALFFSALFPLGRMLNSTQAGILRDQALEQSSSYILRGLSRAFEQATCAKIPAAGAGRVLLLHLGRDCEGELLSDDDRYAVACLDAAGRLRYRAGPWGDAFTGAGAVTAQGAELLSCSPGVPGWARLGLPAVRAQGSFAQDTRARNRVRLSIELRLDPAIAASGRVLRLETGFAFQGSL